MRLLSYKGYHGTVEYSPEDHVLFGEVLGLSNGVISYEGKNVDQLIKDFQDGINDYLAGCKEEHKKPLKEDKSLLKKQLNKEIQEAIAAL